MGNYKEYQKEYKKLVFSTLPTVKALVRHFESFSTKKQTLDIIEKIKRKENEIQHLYKIHAPMRFIKRRRRVIRSEMLKLRITSQFADDVFDMLLARYEKYVSEEKDCRDWQYRVKEIEHMLGMKWGNFKRLVKQAQELNKKICIK